MSTFLVDFYDEVEEEIEDIEPLKCHLCSFETQFEDVLKRHIFSSHPEPPAASFDSPDCDYKTTSQVTSQDHVIEHERPYMCEHCGSRFKRGDHLRKHLNLVHKGSEAVKWFQCLKCKFKGRSEAGLNHHRIKMHDGTGKKCYFCNYTSEFKHLLKAHMVKKHRSPKDLVNWLGGLE